MFSQHELVCYNISIPAATFNHEYSPKISSKVDPRAKEKNRANKNSQEKDDTFAIPYL